MTINQISVHGLQPCALVRDNHTTIYQILKNNGLHPYHSKEVQDLRAPGTGQSRVRFCRNFIGLCNQNRRYVDRILFTDECMFTPNRMFNSKNFVEWHDINPNLVRAHKTQFRWSIHVCAGMIGNRVRRANLCVDNQGGHFEQLS